MLGCMRAARAARVGPRISATGTSAVCGAVCGAALPASASLARPFSAARAAAAGHSKWQNIKHTKARNDAKRSQNNTKLALMITAAAREGGPDPDKNVRLASVIETAVKQNVPKRVIDGAVARSIKGAAGGDETVSITYDGIGPGGVALVVETVTDNRNRTAQNVRAAFMKFKGNLGSAAFLFERKGYIDLSAEPALDFDHVFETALELGVDDVVDDDGTITLYVPPTELASAAAAAREHFKIETLGLSYEPVPDQAVRDLDADTRVRLDKLVAMLEDLDDVSNVYTNFRPENEGAGEAE